MKLREFAREIKDTYKGDKSGVPIVGLEHLPSSEVTFVSYDIDTDNTFSKAFKVGHVLFGRRRAYLKKAAVANFEGICSGDITVIEAMPGKIDPLLLPFIIQNDKFFDYAVSRSAGGLSPRVKWSDLADYEIDLPSIDEQHKLAEKLWAAYRLKQSYKRLLDASREMVKSRFIEMFSQHVKEATIESFIESEIQSVKKKYKKENRIQYIDISSIDSESNRVISTTEYTVANAPSRAQQCVVEGDILVSTVRPVNRNIAVIDNDSDNLVASTGFCVLRPKEGYREYLLSIVKSDRYTSSMMDKANGGVYPAVNNSEVLSYAIPNPSPMELRKFKNIYQQADKSGFDGFKSRFIEMFGNPVTNSRNWRTEAIKDVAPELPSKKSIEGKVWLLNLDMIESNTGKVINKVYEDSKNAISVQPFDEDNVLFSKLRPYLNKVVIPDECGLATTELVPLRPNQEKLHKVFLSYLLRGEQFVNFANGISSGTKMPRMPLAELRKFKCILPPMSEQLKFVAIAEQADKSGYYN